MMTGGRWRQRLRDSIGPVLLVVLPLCLFGPFTIFSGNQQEFSAPFGALIRPVLLAGAGTAAVLLALGIVLPPRAFPVFVALLFAFGLVLWIQGNFLVADYGPFTGAAIDWSLESWRNPYEIALWTAVPVLAVIGAKRVVRIAPFASAVLVVLQSAALVTSAIQNDSEELARWQGPSDSMFELSRTRNVIHIVLDAFQSDVFGEILEEERSSLDRSFSGAIFFANHAGAFPTTIASIPAMLTGKVYRNDRPLQRYVRDILKEGSIFTALRESGYRVDSSTGMHHGRESATNFYRLQRPYVSFDDYVSFTSWQLADLSLFRHAPHILRPAIYNDESWRLQAIFGARDTGARRHSAGNGSVILDEFARKLTTATDEPVYKYVHVGIPHRPVVLNGRCEFVGVVRSTRASYKEQARCAVRRVSAILDRLREIGAYDNTFVVISSDHGLQLPPPQFVNNRPTPMGNLEVIAGHAMALLVVKPLGSQGAVRVSRAPTSITDIPATILDGVGVAARLPGEPALRLGGDASRVRPFAMYDWERDDWGQNYFETLDILDINGAVLDGKSWTLMNTIYEPAAGEAARVRGLYELHRSQSGPDYRWSMPDVFFHAPARSRTFEMKVRSIAPEPQTVTVYDGDQALGAVTLRDQSWVTIAHTLPPPARPDAHWVHVHVEPSWRPRGTVRRLGVQTRDVILGP